MKSAVLSTIVLLLAAQWAATADTAALRVQSGTEVADIGQVIQVEVVVDSDERVNLVDLVLDYDPAVLRLMSVDTTTSRFTFDARQTIDADDGRLHLIRGEPHATAPRGPGLPLCELGFRVIGRASSATVTAVFARTGTEVGSAVYKDDGRPTQILTTVASATIAIHLPGPRPVSGRHSP